MSLFLFSTIILSLVYLLIFNNWWIDDSPFAFHFTTMFVIGFILLIGLLLLIFIPVWKRQSSKRVASHLDNPKWATEVTSRLSSPAAVIEDHTVTFANKAFLIEVGMVGMSDQIVGMPLSNIVHPGDHVLLSSLLANFEESGKDDLVLRLICLDGTYLPTKFSLSPISNEGNRMLLQFSVIRNNTSTEISFIEQFNYHLLINRLDEVVFQLHRDNIIDYLNPSWEQLLEYAVDESLGKSFIDFVHPEDKPLTISRLDSVSKGKRLRCTEQIRLLKRNGESIWVELRAKNSSINQNESANVVGTITDIQEARKVEASLKSNRHSLSSLLNSVPCMIYRRKSDSAFNFDFVSDGCVDITGYGAEDLLGNKSLSFIKLLHPDDRPAWEQARASLSQQEHLQIVYRLYCRNGVYNWVWEQGIGIYSSTGELLAVEGFIAILGKEGTDIFNSKCFNTLKQLSSSH